MPVADAIDGDSLRHAVLEANASEEADTIVLGRGTYDLSIAGSGEDAAATGDLDIVGTLTIRGAGERMTTIDASALGDRAFDLLSGGSLIIENATIRGGHAQEGGAIRVDEGDLTMIRCHLLENTARGVEGGDGQGGAVYVDAGSATVRRCEFQDNEAIGADSLGGWHPGGYGRGGAIYLSESEASIFSTRFEDNSAAGGLASSDAASSGGAGSGGAVFGTMSDVTVGRSFFGSNSATGGNGLDGDYATAGGEASGGAILVQSGSSLLVQETVFDANTARGGVGGNGPHGGSGGGARGGAVYRFWSDVVADACTFRGNEALGGDAGTGGVLPSPRGGDGLGGAIGAYLKSPLSITNSRFLDNRAVGGRGGDGAEGGYGGDGGLGQGGAVWSASSGGPDFAATLTISRSLLRNNEALGGVAGQGDSGNGHGGAGSGGGVALGTNVETSLVGVRILGNRAVGVGPAQGGGLDSLATKVAIIDSLFADNQALGGTGSFAAGGGIQAKDTQLNVSGTIFRQNVARGGEGIGIYDGGWGYGGAVSLLDSTASFSRSVFHGNRTAGGIGGESSDGGGAEGGALWHYTEAGSLDLTRCIFVHNRAEGGAASPGNEMGEAAGGAVWAGPAESLLMTSCLVHRNSAFGVTGRGGGIFLDDEGSGSAIIQRSIVTGNFASTEGDDIFGPYTT